MTTALRGAAALALLGCSVLASAPRSAQAARSALSREVLSELRYEGLLEEGEAVRLHHGRWTGAAAGPGGASRPTASLVPYLIARGDLDGDGRDDAVVFLQSGAGGSGSFLYLAAVLDRPLGPLPLPAQAIGDRRVVLDAVVSGPDDALCCPSQRLRRTFVFAEGGLREIASQVRGRLHVRELAGTRWLLTRLDAASPVPPDAGIELRFEGPLVAGSAGCNEFQAEVLSGERDALEIGPVTATRRTCPAPVLARERRFLEALGRAHRLGFFFGRLELQYDTLKRRTGRLRFVLMTPG